MGLLPEIILCCVDLTRKLNPIHLLSNLLTPYSNHLWKPSTTQILSHIRNAPWMGTARNNSSHQNKTEKNNRTRDSFSSLRLRQENQLSPRVQNQAGQQSEVVSQNKQSPLKQLCTVWHTPPTLALKRVYGIMYLRLAWASETVTKFVQNLLTAPPPHSKLYFVYSTHGIVCIPRGSPFSHRLCPQFHQN